jgi:E3 ubiquitin-protein ligase FANCL
MYGGVATWQIHDFILDCYMQMPLLRGSYRLEKMAFRMSWIAGRSGKHMFLKDIKDEKPPLLLQMVTDYGDLHFMYAINMLELP